MLRISYIEHNINEKVRNMEAALVGTQEPLSAKAGLVWSFTKPASLCKIALQGTLDGGLQKKG
ncbi:hypothetical protein DPMN_043933 [Dreissena polymorpha]|uniref:Uncharacterized protein n=1 Tax=Dreissena polymorpha TaxID=45954 RepID=A0A9D4HW22_DREPO|nr:hypothetical protein DPMN_043933 [Dreissena polymorpha]